MFTELIAPLPLIINSVYLASVLFIAYFVVVTLVSIAEFVAHMFFHKRELAELKKMRKAVETAGAELDKAIEIHVCKEEKEEEKVTPAPRKRAPAKRSRSQTRRVAEMKKTV